MQSLQIETTEAISAAILPQVGTTVHLAPSRESFGLKWQQEVEASGRSSAGPLDANGSAVFCRRAINHKDPIQATGATSSEDFKTKAADTADDTTRDQRVLTTGPPHGAPARSGPNLPTLIGKATAGDVAAKLDGPAATSNREGDMKGPGEPDVIAGEEFQKQAPVLPPIPAVQGDVPVAAQVNSLSTEARKPKYDAKIPAQSNVVAGGEFRKEHSAIASQPNPAVQESVPVAAKMNSRPTLSPDQRYDAKIPSQFNAIAESRNEASAPQQAPANQGNIAVASQADTIPTASAKPKHDAKFPSQSNGVPGAESQEASADPVLSIPAAQETIPVAIQVDAAPIAIHNNSGAATGTSSTTNADLPSKVGSIENSANSQPAQIAGKGVASIPGKQVMGAVVGGPGENRSSGSATQVAGQGLVPGATTAVSAPVGDLHANLLGTAEPAMPVLPQSHASSISSRDGAQLVVADTADAKGIGSPAVLSSGPTQLDVGVFDGTHGWLRIRAELGAGGAVNASLTASTSAHESLRAALPAMTNYLGSEAVSVSTIAVHRFAQGTHTMSAMSAQGQPNGDTQGHQAGSDQAQSGTGAQRKTVAAADQDAEQSASAVASRLPGSDPTGMEDPGKWTSGYAGATSRGAWPFAVSGGGSGSWLNVSA